MQIRLKEIAKKRKMTLKKISEILDVTEVTLSYWATGKVLIPSARLPQLAEALNCEITELIPTGRGFSHFYDSITGEYLGTRKI